MKRTIPSKTQNNLSCNFEDGQTITLTNHMHRYDSPGFYVATDLWTDHYVLNIFNPVVQINNQSLNNTLLSWNFVNGTSIDGETSLVHTLTKQEAIQRS